MIQVYVRRDDAPQSARSRCASPNAFEVSCRVRVGEVTRPARAPGFTPRSVERSRFRPAVAPNWVPRLCHAVSYDSEAVAELGVRPEAPQEGGKRAERTPITPGKSHVGKDPAACRNDSPRPS